MNCYTHLFAYAHLDDETILSYGTIQKIPYDEHIVICSFCGNSNEQRYQVFYDAYSHLPNVDLICLGHENLSLTHKIVSDEFSRIMTIFKPTHIYTHSMADLHFEHRMLAQQSLVHCRASRQASQIVSLLHACSQTHLQAYNQFGTYSPNLFADITKFKDQKIQILESYVKCSEIPDDINDIRSVDSIIAMDKINGKLMGVECCESYQQIFKKL